MYIPKLVPKLLTIYLLYSSGSIMNSITHCSDSIFTRYPFDMEQYGAYFSKRLLFSSNFGN